MRFVGNKNISWIIITNTEYNTKSEACMQTLRKTNPNMLIVLSSLFKQSLHENVNIF